MKKKALLQKFCSVFWLVFIAGVVFGQNEEARKWREIGNQMRAQKRYAESEVAYKMAVELEPAYWQAWQGLGNTYYYWGKKREALQAYEKALEMNPENRSLVQFVEVIRNELGLTQEEEIPETKTQTPQESAGTVSVGSDAGEGVVTIGAAMDIPLGDLKGWSLAFEPSIRGLYYFPGRRFQIGLGTEISYETPTSQDFLILVPGFLPLSVTLKGSSINFAGLVQLRVNLNKKGRLYWWIGPSIGLSRIRRTVILADDLLMVSTSDWATKFLIGGSTGVAWRFGRGGEFSIQPTIGIKYNSVDTVIGDLNSLRLQPGVQFGFHF